MIRDLKKQDAAYGRSAFSLLELVISLIILSLTLAIAAPRWTNYVGNQQVAGAQQHLKNFLAETQAAAMQFGADAAITFPNSTSDPNLKDHRLTVARSIAGQSNAFREPSVRFGKESSYLLDTLRVFGISEDATQQTTFVPPLTLTLFDSQGGVIPPAGPYQGIMIELTKLGCQSRNVYVYRDGWVASAAQTQSAGDTSFRDLPPP